MGKTTKEILDYYYTKDIKQVIFIGGVYYKHLPGEDWFLTDEI